MKKNNLIVAVALLATSIFTACKSNEPSGGDDYNTPAQIGVKINGVVWAPYNVGATGKFVAKPEDYGGLYQWNRKDTANFLLKADYDVSEFASAISWLPANDPSPAGWRVPIFDELKTLLDTAKVTSEWTTVNGINGYRFTDKATSKSIFLPAAGFRFRNGNVAMLYSENTEGMYYSSTQYDNDVAYCLDFYSLGAFLAQYYKSNGFSVRPVAK